MRYWLLSSLAIAIIGMVVVTSQIPFASAQVKDKKEPAKDKKDKTDPKDDPASPKFKEPEFVLGKKFDYWKSKIHSDDPSEREIAMKNILFFGAEKAYEALPDIIQELKYHGPTKNPNIDLSVRVNGIQALHTIFRHKKNPDQKYINETFAICKVNLKKDQQVILRMQTMKGMPTLGPKARSAFDDIVALTRDAISWEMRKEAIPVMVVLAAPEDPKKTNPLTPSALKALDFSSNPEKENSALVRQTALQGIATLGSGLPFEFDRTLKGDPALPVKLTALQCMAAMSQTPRMDAQSKKAQRPGSTSSSAEKTTRPSECGHTPRS